MNDDAQLLRSDEQARSMALDTSRSFIVQAPAGSGKTELLIQRYLGLLARVAAPEEILAITFTRKAAAEMQVRILAALRSAADGIEPEAPHERITAEAARVALAADRDYGWKLLDNPRRMRIQTLDSLNATIARKQPLTAIGGAADTAIVADTEMRALYGEAAALTLDQLAEAGTYESATRDVLLHLDTNAGLYVDYLSQMLQTRDQWLPFIGSGTLHGDDAARLRDHLEQGLERAVTRQLELLGREFPAEEVAALVELGRYASQNLVDEGQADCAIVRLTDLETLPGHDVESLGTWLAIADLLLTAQGTFRKRVTRNQGFPAGGDEQKVAYADLVEALARRHGIAQLLHGVRQLPPVTYTDEQWNVLLALFHLLPLAVTELKRLFGERGIVDHIEVALSARDALGTPDDPGNVALLLDYQVRHLLVDEMQDTSAAQYRMIEALTGGWEPDDGRTLYCVGDPMQSIYRFRNAEVGQFLLSKETGIGSVPMEALTLRRNFRSGAGLVDWFNSVFCDVLPRHDDVERSAVKYETATAVPELSGFGECVVHPLIGADRMQESEMGLATVRDTMQRFPDDDVAVLVRSRSHLAELLQRLRSAGIEYRAVEIDRLTDLPEIIDVLALTRAIVHPGDRHAWLALLRSPWTGLDWADIHAIVLNDRRSTILDLLARPDVLERLSVDGHSAVRRLVDGLLPILAACRTATLRERVERAWMTLGGPAICTDADAIDNVYQFLDVLEALEQAGDLPDVAELEVTLDSEHASKKSTSRVQVMTMHRAKGLQFDHVVLYGLGRVPRPRESRVMSWFDLPDEHGRPLKIISPVGPRADLDRDPVHSYIGQVDAEMDRNELGRLLYVACTRARKSLHLVGHAQLYKSGMRPEKRSLLHMLWPFVRGEFEARLARHGSPASESTPSGWLIPIRRRFESGWQLPEVPPAPVDLKPGSVDEASVEFYWVGSDARLAGTLVHRWLQYAARQNASLDSIDETNVRMESARWLAESGVSERRSAPVIDRTVEALEKMARDPRGQWLLSGNGDAELPLTGLIDGRIESVVLDRVRIDAGTHWIVDYKTSSHEGGNLQHFLEEEVARYSPQLARYALLYRNYAGVSPRCALYFPLLQAFVEVDVGDS